MNGGHVRQNFIRALNRHGGSVCVIRNYQHRDEKRLNISMALYNQSDGRTEFQFAERWDIDQGDHVQQNGAKDLYRVVAKSERMVESVLVSFIVQVERQRF